MPVTAGRYYGARASVYVEKMDTAITSLRAKIYWYKADGTLSAIDVTADGPTVTPARTTTNDLYVVGLAPADAAFAAVRTTYSAGGAVSEYILHGDAFALFDLGTDTKPVDAASQAADVPAYFDGDSAGYRWTGTPHNSTSLAIPPLTAEMGAKYVITGPNGTRAVIGDSADPDFVGYLTEPPSGLSDDPEVRFASEPYAERDGAIINPSFMSERAWTMTGFLNVEPASARNIAQDKLRRAMGARRGTGTLDWTSSEGYTFRCSFRQQGPTRFTNRRPRNFIIAAANPDPRIYSDVEHTQTVAVTQTTPSGGGAKFPLSFPLSFAGGSQAVGAELVAVNLGDTEEESGYAPVLLTVTGPVTGPLIVRNETLSAEVRLNLSLGVGEFVTLDSQTKQIVLNGQADRRNTLDYLASQWWSLAPGVNVITLGYTTFGAGAQLSATWRDAWL